MKLVEQGVVPRPPARPTAVRPADGAGNAVAAPRPARGVKAGAAKSTAKVPAKRGSKPAKSVEGVASSQPRGRRLAAKPQPIRVVKIKELNAQGKCGPGTSVVHLFRVDEVCDGAAAVHLVFYDRHGWYCEHGRSCPAVDDVRKLAGSHLARTYKVG